jgi:acetate kinase
MKILVLNSGSSSLKFQLFTVDPNANADHQLVASGMVEKIGERVSHSQINCVVEKNTSDKGEKPCFKKEFKQQCIINDHQQALEEMMSLLKTKQCLSSLAELSGIGHRVVHGGEYFSHSVIIDDKVIEIIHKLSPLAPLHNPANLMAIKLIKSKVPQMTQVAVFDTAFHQTLPKPAYIYALPHDWYEKYHVRRYGFHGTSHYYVSKKATNYLMAKYKNDYQKNTDIKLISIHLGNGTSATAILNGQSIDTSMGLTPLEGLVMGTRCGDIDPAILFYLHQETSMSFADLDQLLNKQSGLKGICGENDMRTIIELAEQGDRSAELAIHIFCYHIKKYIGAYIATLNGVDAIIFTGGIGENSSLVRQISCQNLENLGLDIDASTNSLAIKKSSKKNEFSNDIMEIQSKSSAIKVLVIPTNEELEIANQTIKKIISI